MSCRRLSFFFCLLAGVFAGLAGFCRNTLAVQGGPPPSPADLDGLQFYRNARPIVDWSAAEVTKAMPELKGFESAESQEALPFILRKVGGNVAVFFHNFVNTASVEETHQVRMRNFGPVEDTNYMKLNYLLVPITDRNGERLQEYRTDSHGKSVKFSNEAGGFMLTSGFASIPVYFHPKHQPESTFRYLGRKLMQGQETLLVLFAQHTDRKAVLGRFRFGNTSVPILVQGVAWIDSTNYQIVRMRTDLLAPLSSVFVEQATTDISFEEMRFKGLPDPMWLPREVDVTLRRGEKIYHNQHRYSDYKLFNVEAGEKPVENSNVRRPK